MIRYDLKWGLYSCGILLNSFNTKKEAQEYQTLKFRKGTTNIRKVSQ